MNKLANGARWVVEFALAMVFYLAAPVSALLLIGSFFGSRVPSASGFDVFVSTFGLWLYLVAGFSVAVAVLHRQIQGGNAIFTVMIGIALAMLVRVGPSISMFGEVWLVLGSLGTLFVAHLLSNRGAGSKERQLQGREEQHAAPADVAIRYQAVKPRYSFVAVIGMKDVKTRLLAAGKEVVASQGKGAQTRNGILMTGKPGNGKTFIAEALAGELKLPFLSVAYGDVASKWINETTENVIKVFRDAVAQAPCVLFVDEIDSLISSRNGNSSGEESAKTTNAILTELVNIRRAGVVVVAASNFVDRLDPAAIREGRFDFKIEITAPDSVARRHMIATKCNIAISEETIETAVRRWDGFSVARITAVMEEANRMAQQSGLITFQLLQSALRNIQGRKGNIPEDTPTVDQLTMDAESKQRLMALARRMDKIMEIEAMGGSVPRGVLFYGPPGTGKTLTARALSKTANWAFLSVSGMDLISDPKRIDALVEEASELRPCVVFIDEADDVFKDRRYSNTATVTNKLLAAMDGAGGKVPDILFVAATNHPDAMDSAALRGGRFTEKIEFGLPSEETLVEFLRKWKDGTKAKLAPSFSLDGAARRLVGNPMANVREILQMAINNAISRLEPDEDVAVVDMEDLDAAVESVQGNIANA